MNVALLFIIITPRVQRTCLDKYVPAFLFYSALRPEVNEIMTDHVTGRSYEGETREVTRH